MRACAFVWELWRKKQMNLNTMRSMQICGTKRHYGDSRLFHYGYCFIQSPLATKANQVVTSQVFAFQNALIGSFIQQCGFFSSGSSQTNENEAVRPWNEPGSTLETNNADRMGPPDEKANLGATGISQSVKRRRRRRSIKRTKFSDSDSDSDSDSRNDLSRDDLVKLLAKKEELLKEKQREMEVMQDKAMRSCAETDNVIERAKREAENSKKFSIQSFAKSLLDVADNLGRASSVVKSRVAEMDTTEDTASAGALPLLKTLLEGVEMTEKQLAEVFKKFGVERFDPANEQFDPSRHNRVSQLLDPSKPPNTVAVVMKPGYMLHEQVIRPADVGVTVGMAADNRETD